MIITIINIVGLIGTFVFGLLGFSTLSIICAIIMLVTFVIGRTMNVVNSIKYKKKLDEIRKNQNNQF